VVRPRHDLTGGAVNSPITACGSHRNGSALQRRHLNSTSTQWIQLSQTNPDKMTIARHISPKADRFRQEWPKSQADALSFRTVDISPSRSRHRRELRNHTPSRNNKQPSVAGTYPAPHRGARPQGYQVRARRGISPRPTVGPGPNPFRLRKLGIVGSVSGKRLLGYVSSLSTVPSRDPRIRLVYNYGMKRAVRSAAKHYGQLLEYVRRQPASGMLRNSGGAGRTNHAGGGGGRSLRKTSRLIQSGTTEIAQGARFLMGDLASGGWNPLPLHCASEWLGQERAFAQRHRAGPNSVAISIHVTPRTVRNYAIRAFQSGWACEELK